MRLTGLASKSKQHDDTGLGVVGRRHELIQQRLIPLHADQTIPRLRHEAIVGPFGRNSVHAGLLNWKNATYNDMCRNITTTAGMVCLQCFDAVGWVAGRASSL